MRHTTPRCSSDSTRGDARREPSSITRPAGASRPCVDSGRRVTIRLVRDSPPDKYLYSERFHSAMVRRDLAMAAKKAKGDDWFSSLDAELEKKTKEIIEGVGEQNVARLELNKTLIEDFWKVWK